VETARAAGRAAGASHPGGFTTFNMPHRTQREGCLRDPDGVLVNVIERPIDEQFDTRTALEIAASR